MLNPHPSSKALSDTEKLNWLRLTRAENVGPITFYRLLERYGSVEQALDALPELSRKGGRKKPLTAPSIDVIEAEYNTLKNLGGDIVTARCPSYPIALSAIDDAPPVLSYFGDIGLANKDCVAIVGARNASFNGRKFASKLSHDLVLKNQIIASGLARGIDTAAHKGALHAKEHESTIAVVAGGIDVIYPEENTALFEEIKERGLILAESPLGQEPVARLFPRRNRIVSGLSRAAIVVEATLRSGSLITARMAGEQGRDIMAVPGHPLDPRAQGPNHLIREGATLIRNAEDVIEILQNFSGTAMREPFNVQPLYSAPLKAVTKHDEIDADELLSHLSFTPIAVDELIRSCQYSIPALQVLLLELELAGRIERLAGNRVSLLEAGK